MELLVTIGTGLAKVAPALQLGGTLLSAGGLVAQGRAESKAAEFNAAQMVASGKAEAAVAQREAEQKKREKELMLSRARAVGAASGGGIDIDLMGDIEEEGELAKLTTLWQGEERRKGRNAQAATSMFEGLARKRASLYKATGTLLSGGSSFAERFS